MEITIDSRTIAVQAGQTVLQAALEHDIYIPHLCSHPDLEAAGGCRLCVVEIAGRNGVFPACETMVEDGMVVWTHTQQVEHIRRLSMELMLASHPSECTDCPKYGNCELQSLYQYLNASAERWRTRGRPVPEDAGNPLIRHLFTRCIRCGRCVRACGSLRGAEVLDYRKRRLDVRVGTQGGVSLADAGCRFCGACVEVCPTGAITDAVGALNPDLPRAQALVPCRSACPGGVDIPAYLRCASRGDWANAAAVIRESVPLPAVLGSVCPHPCEEACRRGQVNEPISICRLKRLAAEAAEKSWTARRRRDPVTGRRVAVVGGGPAGLTAAYYLAAKGHAVTVYEAEAKCGGQLRVGIPAYRLPDELLDRELEDILSADITLCANTRVEKPAELLKQGFDAVLVAIGTHKGSVLPLEGRDLPGVLVNTQFLRAVRLQNAPPVGRRVAVLGGGNVAVDCARTALRLGAEEVSLVCLEARDAMTASPEEIAEAQEEGIKLYNSRTFLSIEGEQSVTGLRVQEVAGFHFDENRRAVITPREGTEQVLPVETVIFAVGQSPAGSDGMGLALQGNGYFRTGADGAASVPGIYAAGDAVTGTKTVIEAIAAGRACAGAIDRYLGGDGDVAEHLADPMEPDRHIGRREQFATLARVPSRLRTGGERRRDFAPVEQLPDCTQAACEAARCLQCDLRLQLGRNKLWNEYPNEGGTA